jgi:hypothetical protein
MRACPAAVAMFALVMSFRRDCARWRATDDEGVRSRSANLQRVAPAYFQLRVHPCPSEVFIEYGEHELVAKMRFSSAVLECSPSEDVVEAVYHGLAKENHQPLSHLRLTQGFVVVLHADA